MSRTSSAALQTLKSIASRWPVDNVRPKLQLSAAITEAASKAFGAESVLARSAPKGTRQLTKPENEWAAKFEGSMRRLLENRAMATYPITDKTLKPASYPDHYSKLQQGLDRVKRGDTPRTSWLEWVTGKKT